MSKELREIRGLIFQHSPMNDISQNGRTMSVFMSKFQAKNLGQIYVTDFPICSDRCKHSYRISENNMMKKTLRKGVRVGYEVVIDDKKNEEYSGITFGADVNRFLSRPKIKCYVQLVREYFWKKRYWDSDDFRSWINKVCPDFILFTSGPIPEEFNMIREISERLSIPLVLYVSDDYVTPVDYYFFGKKRYYRALRIAFESVYEKAKLTISISKEMQQHLQKEYGRNEGNYIVAMNAIKDIFRPVKTHNKATPLLITYMGNLGIGRLETIEKLSIALTKTLADDSRIMVYTGSVLSKRELDRLNKSPNIIIHRPVFGTEKDEIIESSDVLLHIESFDEKYQKILSTAMSTKTPELLQSKVPVLIVGPKYSATVSFFQNGKFGTVINTDDEKKYEYAIRKIYNNDPFVAESIDRAYSFFSENYTEDIISTRVANSIQEIIDGDQ